MKHLFKGITILISIVLALVFTGCEMGSGESSYAAPLVFYSVKVTPANITVESGEKVILTATNLTKTTTDYNEDENGITTTENVSLDKYDFDWSYTNESNLNVTDMADGKKYSFTGKNFGTSSAEVKVTLKVLKKDGSVLCSAPAFITIRPNPGN